MSSIFFSFPQCSCLVEPRREHELKQAHFKEAYRCPKKKRQSCAKSDDKALSRLLTSRSPLRQQRVTMVSVHNCSRNSAVFFPVTFHSFIHSFIRLLVCVTPTKNRGRSWMHRRRTDAVSFVHSLKCIYIGNWRKSSFHATVLTQIDHHHLMNPAHHHKMSR